MANMSAVQILINLNGKSLTLYNNKKNVVSLKISRVLGDAANKFTLELFDESAWKLESALYKTKNTPISIQYGATGDWANGKHITFSGICTNYNLSFVGAATMLSIEGVIHGVEGISGSSGAGFWFRNDTICWVDKNVSEPSEGDANQASWRAGCAVDGKWYKAGAGPEGKGDQGFDDAGTNGNYADYVCARLEWLPPKTVVSKEQGNVYNTSDTWRYRVMVSPSNIFKRIIRKYNGEIGTGNTEGSGNFILGEVDDSLWVDADCLELTQNNESASSYITNVLCKAAIKEGAKTAGYRYFIKDGKHCFKAIDYSAGGENKVIKTGYYTRDSDVISFALNYAGAMVMAGKDVDDAGKPLVDAATLDSLTGDFIDTNLYNYAGHYVDEEAMTEEQKGETETNWYFKPVSSIKIVSSSNQSLLDSVVYDSFETLKSLTLSATLTVWGEYNNKYVPGNYIDLTVMTPDGKQHYSSGKYFIISADDSITADGYTTTLKLLKNLDRAMENSNRVIKADTSGSRPGEYLLGIDPYSNITPNANGYTDVSSTVSLTPNDVEKSVWDSLKARGYSDIATAAVMGNISCESGFRVDAIEKGNSIGFGLCQWSFGRRTNLENWAKSQNKSPSDLGIQIQFLLGELTPGGGCNGYASYQIGGTSSSRYDGHSYTKNDWENSSVLYTSTVAFMALFERPSYDRNTNHLTTRVANAEQYRRKYANK